MSKWKYEDLTVNEVHELVESGDLSAKDALGNEIDTKKRTTLIERLQQMMVDNAGDGLAIPDDVVEEDQEETKEVEEEENTQETGGSVSCVLLKNIKYQGQRFKIGQTISIDANEVDAFVKAKIIKGD